MKFNRLTLIASLEHALAELRTNLESAHDEKVKAWTLKLERWHTRDKAILKKRLKDMIQDIDDGVIISRGQINDLTAPAPNSPAHTLLLNGTPPAKSRIVHPDEDLLERIIKLLGQLTDEEVSSYALGQLGIRNIHRYL